VSGDIVEKWASLSRYLLTFRIIESGLFYKVIDGIMPLYTGLKTETKGTVLVYFA